jgi:hypothetical protein
MSVRGHNPHSPIKLEAACTKAWGIVRQRQFAVNVTSRREMGLQRTAVLVKLSGHCVRFLSCTLLLTAKSGMAPIRLASLVACALASGCAWHGAAGTYGTVEGGPAAFAGVANPLLVPVADPELAWNQIVDEIDDYFKVRREERVRLVGNVLTEGHIETFPTIGSTILEPWRRDSTPGFERLHASLQSIRRRAQVRVIPSEGGYLIEVAVYKELEDVLQPEYVSAGQATLRHDTSPEKTEDGERLPPGTIGWIPLGRDVALEQRILANLRGRLSDFQP